MVRIIPLLAKKKPGFIRAKGLDPRLVVEVDGADPTRDTYQRKVFFDGKNFFIVYWDLGDKKIYYVASRNGKVWTTRTELEEFSVAPYYGGNVDVGYPNKVFDLAMHFTGSNGAASYWRTHVISGQTLTRILPGGGTVSSSEAQGGSVVSNNSLRDFMMYHANANRIKIHKSPATIIHEYDDSVSHGGTTTGGNQLLPYKTSSPYNMLGLAKGGDDKLYYNTITTAGSFVDASFTEIATLGTGFSDFCACSEAQNIGDPEIIHLVYIKSTGELCYRKFEDDTWSSETELVESGATYPVIALGKSIFPRKLYVFYVKDGNIKMRKYIDSWHSESEPFNKHTFDTPTYLSTNQNAHNGRVCLVWTEESAAPYKIWFAYLMG